MAVRILVNNTLPEDVDYVEVSCKSTDTKPVSGRFANGSLLLEIDSGDVYAYDEDGGSGSEWVKVAALGGGS